MLFRSQSRAVQQSDNSSVTSMSSKLRGKKSSSSSSSFSITIQHRHPHPHRNHHHHELPLKASCSSGDTASHSFTTSASTISETSEHDNTSELLLRRQQVRDMLTKAMEEQERKRDDFRRMMDHKQSTVNAHLEQDNEYGAILVMKQVLKTESQLEKSIRIIATLDSMRSSVMSMGEAMESLESYQYKLDTVVSSPAPAVQYTKPRDILKLAQLRHKLCQKEARGKELPPQQQQQPQRAREVEEEKEEIEPPTYHDDNEHEDDHAAAFKLPALERHETEDYHSEHLEV